MRHGVYQGCTAVQPAWVNRVHRYTLTASGGKSKGVPVTRKSPNTKHAKVTPREKGRGYAEVASPQSGAAPSKKLRPKPHSKRRGGG